MPSNTFLNKFRPYRVDGLVRMGHFYDGGYIVHEPSIKDVDVLVNYGVGYKVDFEKEFFKKTGKPTIAFDPTLYDASDFVGYLKKRQFVHFFRQVKNLLLWSFIKPSLKKFKIDFIEEGIAEKDLGKYKTISTHFNEHSLLNKKIILKIDVEGAEYPVFDDPGLYKLLNNSVLILMELHDVDKQMESLEFLMDNIIKTHTLVHIHSNNHAGTFRFRDQNVPRALEVSLLLNEYLPKKEYSTETYPIKGLDHPCDKTKADIPLDFFL